MNSELLNKIVQGDVPAAARLISRIEDEDPGALPEMNNLYPYTGKAYIVGITGPPGAGKSTLINSLISLFRKKKLTIGVVAIDPSSAFTGGALLGDRIRMQKHSKDKGVFIRSLATRGWVGGLAKATVPVIHVMDAMGKDIVFVETVGSGQIEIDISKATDTTIMVMTPGAGDEVQMMKAGILEAADIFVINKADKEGADVLRTDLKAMLEMKSHLPNSWQPDIILTEAISGKGTAQLVQEILRHKEYLIASGELAKRRKERARFELTQNIEDFLKNSISHIERGKYLERLVDNLLQGKITPYAATLKLANRLAKELQPGKRIPDSGRQ